MAIYNSDTRNAYDEATGTMKVTTGAGSATTAVHSNVAASTGSTKLLDAYYQRRGAMIYNDSTSAVYIKLGTAASSTSFAIKLNASSLYEIPYGFTGAVYGAWVSATGSARVTEVSA